MKKFLSLVLALVMTMSLVTISAGAKDFTDADKVNYDEAIAVLSAVKVIDGYTDGSFKPQTQLNRGQAAKIICNLILGPTTAAELHATAAPFSDVPADNIFAGYITYCANKGIIGGYADGTFRPTGTLTGYAFMKMLLGALGYDANVEGYNIPGSWSIQVAKQAIGIGLNKGLKDTFDGTKPVTREEACLYALNTLKADLVEYGSKTNITVGGSAVVIGDSEAKAQKWNNSITKIENIKKDGYIQFAEQYFPKLELEIGNGIYGRPTNVWKLKKAEIGAFTSIEPTVVYTEGTASEDVYKDLGKVVCDKNEYDWSAYVNGKAVPYKEVVAPEKSEDDDYAYTGDGTVTEIYVDDDAETVTVCEINYYLGQVTKVKSDDDGEYITVNVLSKEPKLNEKTFYVEGYEEDDYVVFTVDYNDDDKYIIGEVCEPETVSGDVTRVELDKDADVEDAEYGKTYLKMDGDKHVYSAAGHIVYDLSAANKLAHPELNEDYTLYLDPNGFVLAFEKTEAEVDQYLYVKDSDEELKDWVAKVVLTDATSAKVDLKEDLKKVPDNATVAGTNNPAVLIGNKIKWVDDDRDGKITNIDKTNIDERVWKYSVSDKGVYTLTYVAQEVLGLPQKDGEYTAKIFNGKAYITDGDNDYIVDKQTVFVDMVNDKAYTGYNEVPNVEKAHLIVVGGKVADVVFILDGEIYDEDSTYFVLEKTTRESLKYDDDPYWNYTKAYVNGDKTGVIVAYDALTKDYTKLDAVTWANKLVYKAVKTIDEQYIQEVQIAASKVEGDVTAVGDDAFWITDVKDTKHKFDCDEETVFVTVEFDEKAKLTSISEGDLNDMDLDEDDYDVFVKVLKTSDNDEHADLVYIFTKEKAEAVIPGIGGADEWARITNTSSSALTAEIIGVDAVGEGYTALELCKQAMKDAGYTYKYTDANGELVGMMGDRIYTFTNNISSAYEVTLTENVEAVSIASDKTAYVVQGTKLNVTLVNKADWNQQGKDMYNVTADGFTASEVVTDGKTMTVTLTCNDDLTEDTEVTLSWSKK